MILDEAEIIIKNIKQNPKDYLNNFQGINNLENDKQKNKFMTFEAMYNILYALSILNPKTSYLIASINDKKSYRILADLILYRLKNFEKYSDLTINILHSEHWSSLKIIKTNNTFNCYYYNSIKFCDKNNEILVNHDGLHRIYSKLIDKINDKNNEINIKFYSAVQEYTLDKYFNEIEYSIKQYDFNSCGYFSIYNTHKSFFEKLGLKYDLHEYNKKKNQYEFNKNLYKEFLTKIQSISHALFILGNYQKKILWGNFINDNDCSLLTINDISKQYSELIHTKMNKDSIKEYNILFYKNKISNKNILINFFNKLIEIAISENNISLAENLKKYGKCFLNKLNEKINNNPEYKKQLNKIMDFIKKLDSNFLENSKIFDEYIDLLNHIKKIQVIIFNEIFINEIQYIQQNKDYFKFNNNLDINKEFFNLYTIFCDNYFEKIENQGNIGNINSETNSSLNFFESLKVNFNNTEKSKNSNI